MIMNIFILYLLCLIDKQFHYKMTGPNPNKLFFNEKKKKRKEELKNFLILI